MEAEYNHLNHATWECKYHVVFTHGREVRLTALRGQFCVDAAW
jgi:REP element-mobilizing transposase RayT